MSTWPAGLQTRQNPQGQSHLARTSGLRDSTEYCWDHAACVLSHKTDDSLGSFSIILSTMRGTDVIIHGNPIFFSNVFP